MNLEDQYYQCEIEFKDGVESLQDQRSGLILETSICNHFHFPHIDACYFCFHY